MSFISKGIINEITASSIERYLLLRGWTRDLNFNNKSLMVFHSEENNRKIAIPADENFDDFYIVLEKVLQTISLYEKRESDLIIKEILSVYFDRLEFRIVSNQASEGKLPLDYASNCIQGIKDLVIYASCAEINAQPICTRATKQAMEDVGDFNLAQTEHGSFIINIDVKVIDENTEQLTVNGCLPDSPFEHRVVKRINTAIQQVNDIVVNKELISDIAEKAYETGITANMCDAFQGLKSESGSSEVDTTIRYASALTKTLCQNDRIIINNNHFYAMDELSKIYRNKTLYQDVVLKGVVTSLSKHDKEDIVEKTIKLMTLYDGKYRVILMDLSDIDYRAACDAHRDENEVEVAGELDMSNRTYVLSKIEYFRT